MNAEVQTKVHVAQIFSPVGTGLLQRKCALSNTPGLVKDRSKRDEEELTRQRSPVDYAGSVTAPLIVLEVLRTQGRPPDPKTRTFMEPRFGHDFSRVRVHSPGPGMIQAKLKINEPGDPYEQEADRVAEQVMRMPAPETHEETEVSVRSQGIHTQRACIKCNEEMRRQPFDDVWQAKEVSGQIPQLAPRLLNPINEISGEGQTLPESVRGFFEPRLACDLSHVRVHTGAKAGEAAAAIGARAFTVGTEIVFGTGQYAPGTSGGNHLLAHELTHTLQQSDGTPMIRRWPVDQGWVTRSLFWRFLNTMYEYGLFEPTRLPEGVAPFPDLPVSSQLSAVSPLTLGGGAVAEALPGQQPPGLLPGQQPPGSLPGQQPPGSLPGQQPPGSLPGQQPPGSLPGQQPPTGVGPQPISLPLSLVVSPIVPLAVGLAVFLWGRPTQPAWIDQRNSVTQDFYQIEEELLYLRWLSDRQVDYLRFLYINIFNTEPIIHEVPVAEPRPTETPFTGPGSSIEAARRQRPRHREEPPLSPTEIPEEAREVAARIEERERQNPCLSPIIPLYECSDLGYRFNNSQDALTALRRLRGDDIYSIRGTEASRSADCFRDGRPRPTAEALALGATHTTYYNRTRREEVGTIVCCRCCIQSVEQLPHFEDRCQII